MKPERDDALDSLGFVHRFVPATDPSARGALLLLHGTGGDENDLISIGNAVAPGLALVSPRGNAIENGAPRFFRRLSEGRFDPAEVRFSALQLAEFIRATVAAYDIDPIKLFALGYSNGANIASSVMFLYPGLLAGAVLLRPMIVLEPEEMHDLTGRTIFIGAGRLDTIVPTDQPERLANMFRKRGASVTLSWQVSGHNLAPADIAAAARWLEVQLTA